MAEYLATVVSNRTLNESSFILELQAAKIAQTAVPGQFVNLSAGQFLRRPLGILSVKPAAGIFSVGIQHKGEGTRWLKEQHKGAQISVLGPLGNGFALNGYEKIITIGGGTGVFPLFFVQEACRAQGLETFAICGFMNKDCSVLIDDYRSLGCQTLFSSEAGDLDVKGLATDALNNLLQQMNNLEKTVLLACGPRPMLKAVAALAKSYDLPCQVSLEERMACGFGVCLTCACAVNNESDNADRNYSRCCVDGPVFDAKEIKW